MSHDALIVHTATGERSLSAPRGASVREALEHTSLRLTSACGGTGGCGSCVVRVVGGEVSDPTVAEQRRLSTEELARGLRLACQLRLEGDAQIEREPPSRHAHWHSIPEDELAPFPVRPPGLQRRALGLAVDLGTSQIRVALCDCVRGRRIATRHGPNPQGAWGADVLSRLSAARSTPRRSRSLAVLARSAILRAVGDMLASAGFPAHPSLAEIGRLIVVGNTAMLASLTERGGDALLDPDNWQHPIDYRPRDAEAWNKTWGLPHARVLLPQAVAGFVGSDLLASLLATGLTEGPAGSLLLDVGTNIELALWDGETLHVTSVPGGSAFEGGGIRFGMAAEPGAIERVLRHPSGQGFVCETRGGLPAQGLCGSGLIDAVSLLVTSGIVRPSGRFARAPGPQGHRLDPELPRSAITAADIDAVQRAKAATAAAMEHLLARAGMGGPEVARLCVCGAFGQGLDLRHAQAVGLLPEVPVDRIELHANAALAGCERALLAEDPTALFSELVEKTKAVNLASAEGWEDRYVAHLRLAPIPQAPRIKRTNRSVS